MRPKPKPEPRGKKPKKPLKRSWLKLSKKAIKNRSKSISKAERYYAMVYDTKPHICENCDAYITVVDPKKGSYVSHIVSKGNNEALYYDPENNFLLCAACENQWTRISPMEMKIWPEAERRKERLNHKYYVEKPKIPFKYRCS